MLTILKESNGSFKKTSENVKVLIDNLIIFVVTAVRTFKTDRNLSKDVTFMIVSGS